MVSASATTTSDPIAHTFAALAEQRRKALVAYITAGHPDRARSLAVMRAIARAGADIIEVGVPFSDPLADGPTIQASSQAALANVAFSGRGKRASGRGYHMVVHARPR